MYTEQLAILLLVAANGMTSQGVMDPGHMARMPRGGAEQVSVNLKLDPRLKGFRNPYTGKVVQKRTPRKDVLFASLD